MKRSERQLLWQSRIQAFHTSGEASVAAWDAVQLYEEGFCFKKLLLNSLLERFVSITNYNRYKFCRIIMMKSIDIGNFDINR